ncbi:glycosidase [Salsipaludibacter albus]|uniref:glycoside hydrolase family 130 protein n=1 Tax=Salsipaludibacter albus TaxID=2849650 RepID=UPI001EE3E841|nr:glycosidase [Salsipaludibacter albus]MBY5164095.1 glycosidase [Salsipaludibacter albus]
MPTYTMERRGVLMEGQAGEPNEAWGVLNPASLRDRDGQLLLLPRLVAEGNVSRVGLCRVLTDDDGDPAGVERLGVVLEPDEVWEQHGHGGGVEDPRVTFVEALDVYVMAYTAFGPLGPRPAVAVSDDGHDWQRLGMVRHRYEPDAVAADLNLYINKDGVFFPEPVPGPDGTPSLAYLHRPTWDLTGIAREPYDATPPGVTDPRPSIWVSYVPVDDVRRDVAALTDLGGHREVATPEHPWEEAKIGGGTPPVRTRHGWMAVHHGVAGRIEPGTELQQHVRYCAGVMVHDPEDVSRLTFRSAEPVLEPATPQERDGIVPNVVFPTAIDVRGEDAADVFYGMADSRIGWARLTWSD